MQQYEWSSAYENLVLETDWKQLPSKIEDLVATLRNRVVELHGKPNAIEYQAAIDAIDAVRVLKAERLRTKV
jgi:hypothetical protein